MTSADLTRRGFAGWTRFNRESERLLLGALPSRPGVYCIRCTTERFTLANGTSDILYIGCAGNAQGLRLRVRQYFHPGPTQHTNKRLLTRCGNADSYELGYVVTASGRDAGVLESELLDAFQREHRQLPPENRQQPTTRAPRSVTALSKAQRMFDAVADAPMGKQTRETLQTFVARGDCDGLLAYLERCIATQRDVGRSVQRAGRVSFESKIAEVRQIREEQ